ncbi:MAG: hypothetical protein NW237_05450 [Cyanobacteriota bacterium]|nr:hypothetical protein [Cyanobacteriota bacterium]
MEILWGTILMMAMIGAGVMILLRVRRSMGLDPTASREEEVREAQFRAILETEKARMRKPQTNGSQQGEKNI